MAKKSDYLIIAVKPYMYGEVLEEIKDIINEDQVIIGIGAGISIDYMKKILGTNVLVVKTMPNTPAMVGEGMTALIFDNNIDMVKREEVMSIFNSFGKCEIIDDSLMDGFTNPFVVHHQPMFI